MSMRTSTSSSHSDKPPTAKNEPSVEMVKDIPFTCEVKTKVAETLKFENKVFEAEFTAKAIRGATTSYDDKILVFNAAGLLYRKNLTTGAIEKIAGDKTMLAAEPAFSPNGKSIAWVEWNDEKRGGITLANLDNTAKTTQIGHLDHLICRTPSFSPDGKKIVFRLQEGDDEMGPAMTNKPGIYMVDLPTETGITAAKPVHKFITAEGENPRFSTDGQRILVQYGGSLFGALDKGMKSYDLNGLDEKTLVKSKYGHSFTVSPDGKWLAFIELHKTYICQFPQTGKTLDLSADIK